MDSKTLLWLAGGLQAVVFGANFVIPGRLEFDKHLSGVPPMIRQIFKVHHAYIVLVVAFFAALCFLYPVELAGGSPLGRFVCGFMALFWGARLPVQLGYYDAEVRRQNRVEDVLFTALLATVAGLLLTVFVRGTP